MSHEVMADASLLLVDQGRSDGGFDPGLVADLDTPVPEESLPNLAGPPNAARPGGGRSWHCWDIWSAPRWLPERWLRRSITPIVLVAVALTALAVGAFAGDSQAENTARAQLAAGTRVLLWADAVGVPAQPADGSGQVAFRATLASAGSAVDLQRLRLGVGDGTVVPEVALRPGAKADTRLQLQPNCEVLGRDGPDPSLLNTARAVVRLPGTQRTQEVPLDVVGDASSVLLSLLAPCSLGGYALENADGAAGPPVTVSRMTADTTGRLSFTVAATGVRRAGFDLAVADPTGAPTRFTMTSLPPLPVRLLPGTSLQVNVSLSATCAESGRALPVTYGVLQPQIRLRETTLREGPVEGWDDGVAAAAVTAAAVGACASAPHRS